MNDDWSIDKNAHVFYGMPPEWYDQGMRFYFENVTSSNQPDGSIRLTYPIVDEQGRTFIIGAVRTEGKLIQGIVTA